MRNNGTEVEREARDQAGISDERDGRTESEATMSDEDWQWVLGGALGLCVVAAAWWWVL